MRKNHLIEFFHNNFVNYESCRLKKWHTYDILDMRKQFDKTEFDGSEIANEN